MGREKKSKELYLNHCSMYKYLKGKITSIARYFDRKFVGKSRKNENERFRVEMRKYVRSVNEWRLNEKKWEVMDEICRKIEILQDMGAPPEVLEEVINEANQLFNSKSNASEKK